MKGYYLFAPVERGLTGPDSGVERKVRSQVQALSAATDCELVILPPVEFKGSTAEKVIRRLPLTAAWRKWKYSGEFDDADYLYIRQVYHDQSFARYLASIRRHNPKIRIIYEIPTYPFSGEDAKDRFLQSKERNGQKAAARYIDRIATFYGQDSIWGVPCLKMMNGYDFDQIQIPDRTLDDTIHVISVAITAFWHGYDRLIHGLGRYYQDGGTQKIIYHLVGNILPAHQRLVSKYDLGDRVIFHGYQSGEELRRLLSISSIALDVLGGHRKHYPVSSSLKSREYAAYGLPQITASRIDYLPQQYPYQMLVPYDDSPIDIQAMIAFYHSVYDGRSCREVAEEIRSYAEERCAMRQTMRPVLDWLTAGSREKESL